MKICCSKKQRGSVVVVVTIALPILLVIMGLALDFAHVFVNKTRLQNALDATALSAAIAINGDIAKSTATAETKGKETFNLFKLSSGNAELSGLTLSSANFEYSRTLQPWVKQTTFASNDFVFVKVTTPDKNLDGTSNVDTLDELNVTPVLIRIMSQFNKPIVVPAIATAGPEGNNCELAPFLLCATMPTDLTDMEPVDDDCTTNSSGGTTPPLDCYGYEIGVVRDVEQFFCKSQGRNTDCTEAKLEAGNFNLLNLGGTGGHNINDILKGGTVNTCTGNNLTPLDTKSGRTWGPVKDGINYRIDTLDTNHTDYPSTPDPYNAYESTTVHNHKRIMGIPIGDCRGIQNGSSTLPKVGEGCVFFTKHAPNGSPFTVTIEFIGSCPQNGISNPSNPVLNGPYKIVLFKSPASGDS